MGMEKISEAVLEKVKAEAEVIIKEADNRALESVSRAKKQHQERLEEEKGRLLEAAHLEAARLQAQASLKGRQELLLAKKRVIDDVVSRVKKELKALIGTESAFLKLVEEAMNLLGGEKARLYVSPGDVAAVQKLVMENRELADKIVGVKECDCTGGVIVEDAEGKVRVDNTYETRLEMLLPRLLPEISKELFKE